MSTTPRKDDSELKQLLEQNNKIGTALVESQEYIRKILAQLNTAQQTNAALTADRKRMEKEIARLKAIVDTPKSSERGDQMAHYIPGRKDRFGSGPHGSTACPAFSAPPPISEDEAHDLHQDAARACNRRELELTAHDREEVIRLRQLLDEVRSIMKPQEMEHAAGITNYTDVSDERMVAMLKEYVSEITTRDVNKCIESKNSKYWKDKYTEATRIFNLNSKVAADQVASLQKKLEEAKNAVRGINVDYQELKKELEVHQRAVPIYDRDIAELKAKLESARRDVCASEAPQLVNERDELQRWKQEMLQVLSNLNLQEIGKVLGMPLGIDVSKNILPYIHSLKARLEGAEARARQEAEECAIHKNDYNKACKTIAEMHEAAVGYVGAPIRGVVEDVIDLRAERNRLAAPFMGRTVSQSAIEHPHKLVAEIDRMMRGEVFQFEYELTARIHQLKLKTEGIGCAPNFINHLVSKIHAGNQKWWVDANGVRLERNKAELLCLIHSEISEAMEGERKDLMDDKLPHRKMAEVELADALIRIFDYCGGFNYDLGGAVVEKLEYNRTRADHTHEARAKANGKKF